MTLSYHLQIVNLLAALLLLISFAMLSQRRIAGLITLFAWQGAALATSTALVASIICITRPRSPWCSR
jgi:hydrogenase-4 component E